MDGDGPADGKEKFVGIDQLKQDANDFGNVIGMTNALDPNDPGDDSTWEMMSAVQLALI